jgi:predicted restriction endonuclease
VGQQLFRDALIDYWGGRCSVTSLSIVPLLRASHIRPWAQCASDDERLDVFNGLLLAPHLDALFDDGWIGFNQAGEIILSQHLDEASREKLNVTAELRLAWVAPEHEAYLTYHREHVFRA